MVPQHSSSRAGVVKQVWSAPRVRAQSLVCTADRPFPTGNFPIAARQPITVLRTPQFCPMRTGTQARMRFQTFLITPHLSRNFPGMFCGKSERKLNCKYGWYRSRRSETRPPSCRPLSRTAPPPAIPRPSRPPAPRAMPNLEVLRPLACTECCTEIRGRAVGVWFCFRGARGCDGGGDGAAVEGGGHVGAQYIS